MGRRSLPKYDRAFDTSGHYRELDEIEPPFDPQSLFDKSRPLEIEVGSGKGLFLHTHSQRRPEHNFLGNEIAIKYAKLAAYRLAKSERDNAFMIRGDGLKLFRELLADEICVAVHVYFPDPWWKERHRRRRVIQPEMVKDIQRILVPGGRLHFWTDVEEYFESGIETIKEFSELSGPNEVPVEEADHDMDYRTHFERRMRKNDHPVFRSEFVKQ